MPCALAQKLLGRISATTPRFVANTPAGGLVSDPFFRLAETLWDGADPALRSRHYWKNVGANDATISLTGGLTAGVLTLWSQTAVLSLPLEGQSIAVDGETIRGSIRLRKIQETNTPSGGSLIASINSTPSLDPTVTSNDGNNLTISSVTISGWTIGEWQNFTWQQDFTGPGAPTFYPYVTLGIAVAFTGLAADDDVLLEIDAANMTAAG
jgi:hypothetical protein